jgi:small multidrug resistance pump
VALVGYSIVLSRLNLSTAYPVMAGGGFLLVFVLSALYLREAVTMSQFGGALCIVLGMWLLLR